MRRLPLMALFAAALLAPGCGGGEPAPTRLPELVAAGSFAVAGEPGAADDVPLLLPAPPRQERFKIDGERRAAVVLPLGAWSWRARVPEGGRLRLGAGSVDLAALEVTVALRRGEEREVLDVGRTDARVATVSWPGKGAPRRRPGVGWLDLTIDLAAYAGRDVELEISAAGTAAATPGAAAAGAAEVAWSPAVITADRRPRGDERPNVIFILVDTLRYDHLTPYGYERATSPEIARLLAAPGVVFDNAYSQAPWTLPSAVSYMTSRYPGEILGDNPAAHRIPEELPTLGPAMAALGYRTGAFFGNPILHEGNGFDRGFETFYSPQGMEALERHADDINRRAIPWLEAHRDEPFFLYVHYIDPHDPYRNPAMVDNRSPWFPDPGGVPGEWVHGIYNGKIPIDDLDLTIAHLTALYDSEIRYVDAAIGALIATLPEAVLENTLIVLTADHGEELYDHGGWKHGHTLYEDQIHVPLIARWDRAIPAGRRLAGTVELIDLAPTLVAAAGGEAPPSWRGDSLLPSLTSAAPLPRKAAFAQQIHVFPLRAAAVLDGEKLILFNREEPFDPTDDLQRHIAEVDRARLERMELYDLAADRAERRNLLAPGAGGQPTAAAAATVPPQLATVLYRRLNDSLRGLRALATALPPGARLAGELVFERAPDGVTPLFLGAGDRLELAGTAVTFAWSAEALDKGFLVTGDPGSLVAATLTVDGEPLPAGRLRLGDGAPYTGRPVAPGALTTRGLPRPGDAPGLRLWSRPEAAALNDEIDPRTRESLEALGYIQ